MCAISGPPDYTTLMRRAAAPALSTTGRKRLLTAPDEMLVPEPAASGKPGRGVRGIGFLQRGDLLGRQFHPERTKRIVEMLQFRCADDGGGDDWLVQQPGQRDLRPWHAACLRNLGDAVDDPFVGFFRRALEHAAE